MMTTARFLALFVVALLLSGCKTTVTNLTPAQAPRNTNGLYLFEVALDTSEQVLRKETIKPYVQMGEELYPMKPAPVLKNRWETLVPIAADKQVVNYRYKFDYEYNSIPKRGQGSKLSAPYQLEILQK
jgi:hypothetical protein